MASKRHSLLDFAEQRVRHHGFDAVSFADLAQDAGIRKPSIHYHFPTKADLSFALMERYHSSFMERLAAIDASHNRAAARLLGFLDLYRNALDGGRALCLCVALSVTQHALPPSTRSALGRFQADVAAWLETVFRAAQKDGSIARVADPYTEAHAALAVVEGAQIMARATGDLTRFEAAIDTLRRRTF